MYNNLTISGAVGAAGSGLLGPGEGGATPRTPEILNSVIAMTNPFERVAACGPKVASSPPDESSSSASSPPSVQHTCSQLIKEGLKLTLQTKRKHTYSVSSQSSVQSSSRAANSNDELTPEDEERRRRRRERNKIAATKCRLKKRERTVNLVQESEILETQNHDLKSQIHELEAQRRRLVDMLTVHSPRCIKGGVAGTSGSGQFMTCSSPSPVYQESYPRSTCSSSSDSSASYSAYPSPTSFKRDVTCEPSTSYRHPMEAGGPAYPYQGVSVIKEPSVMYYSSQPHDSCEVFVKAEPVYTTLDSNPRYERANPYIRPSSLSMSGLPTDNYDSCHLLDSPSMAPQSYHHFDDNPDNYSAGFSLGTVTAVNH